MKNACLITISLAFALTFCAQCEEPAPKLDVLLDKAVEAERREDYKAALDFYAQAVKLFPTTPRSWAAYGEHLRFYAHDDAGAASAFHKTVELPGEDSFAAAFAWRGLGELEAKAGHDGKAVEYMEKSLASQPLSDTYRSLCHLMVMHKNWDAAAKYAKAATDLEPGDPIALLLYASQLHRAGRVGEGRTVFRKAMTLAGIDEKGHASGPVHCCVLYNAAGYFGVIGQKDEALKELEAFFKTPNHRHLTREQIAGDPDFAGIKDEPRFGALLAKYLSTQP